MSYANCEKSSHILLRYWNMLYFDEYLIKSLSLILDKKYYNLLKGIFISFDSARSTFMTVLKYDSCNNKIKVLVSSELAVDKMNNPMDIDRCLYSIFKYHLISSLTRLKYSGHPNSFFNFLSLPQTTLEKRCRVLYKIVMHIQG
jgi:hypothetical protein